MANTLKRLVPKVRLEAKTGLGTGTNTCFILHLESEDKADQFYMIWGSGAPGTDYDTADAGSVYFDYTNAEGYVKKATSGWTQMT